MLDSVPNTVTGTQWCSILTEWLIESVWPLCPQAILLGRGQWIVSPGHKCSIPEPHLAWLSGTQPLSVPSSPTKFSAAHLFSSVLFKLSLMLWMPSLSPSRCGHANQHASVAAPTDRASPRMSPWLLSSPQQCFPTEGQCCSPGDICQRLE